MDDWKGKALPEWLVALALAPFIGSFLGVLIRRLPIGEALVMERSVCESCRRSIAIRDLIPVISYVVLRGCCRWCGSRISLFHLQIELAAFAVALSALVTGNAAAPILAGCVLGWTLLALAWIDWRHFILPDCLTLPLLVIGLVVTWLYQPWALMAHSIGAAAGYLAFAGIATVYRRLRGCEGLGAGDAKLLAAAGAWLGWQALPATVLIAAVTGIGMVFAMRAIGRQVDATTAVPFGPCLACAIWMVWLYPGDSLPQVLG